MNITQSLELHMESVLTAVNALQHQGQQVLGMLTHQSPVGPFVKADPGCDTVFDLSEVCLMALQTMFRPKALYQSEIQKQAVEMMLQKPEHLILCGGTGCGKSLVILMSAFMA
jgi:hypothetical protein